MGYRIEIEDKTITDSLMTVEYYVSLDPDNCHSISWDASKLCSLLGRMGIISKFVLDETFMDTMITVLISYYEDSGEVSFNISLLKFIKECMYDDLIERMILEDTTLWAKGVDIYN